MSSYRRAFGCAIVVTFVAIGAIHCGLKLYFFSFLDLSFAGIVLFDLTNTKDGGAK